MNRFAITRRHVVASLAVVLALLLVAVGRDTGGTARAANGHPVYLTCEGERQGAIKGSVTQRGFEGSAGLSAVDHGLEIPADESTGLPRVADPIHRSILITKNVDVTTTKYLNALLGRERLTDCRFRFVRSSSTGAPQEYFRIDIKDAYLLKHDFAGRQGGSDTEKFALNYRTITWTWLLGSGGTATASWTRTTPQ